MIPSLKLMSIDYGEKRVGIASTDESGQFAIPRMVLANNDTLVDKIVEFVRENEVVKVVMGESRNFSGEPNAIMSKVHELKSELEKRGVETVLHPEILTTREARQLQGNTDMTDASAAAIILKSYIESQMN